MEIQEVISLSALSSHSRNREGAIREELYAVGEVNDLRLVDLPAGENKHIRRSHVATAAPPKPQAAEEMCGLEAGARTTVSNGGWIINSASCSVIESPTCNTTRGIPQSRSRSGATTHGALGP